MMTSACLNDKVRIKSGDLAGARGVVVACQDSQHIQLRLVQNEEVVTVNPEDIVNFSASARLAWKTMPKRPVGRPKATETSRTSVTLRIDSELWAQFQALETSGHIANRSEFFEAAIKKTLKQKGV